MSQAYLCDNCRHIDFEYLITSPIEQMLEDIQLNSLAHVLRNGKCAFCRLVVSTRRDVVGGREVDTTVAGTRVMCSMRSLPVETDTRGPRQLLLFMIPTPEGISDLSSMYSLKPKNEASVSEVNGYKSVTTLQIKYELVKKW